MGADNGIYILATRKPPIRNGNRYTNRPGYEYRVAHCQGIDNLDYSDLYMPLLFGDSLVFDDHSKALDHACMIEAEMKKCGHYVLEYGIVNLKYEKYFPNITSRAAKKALNCYVGTEPVDLPDIKVKIVKFGCMKDNEKCILSGNQATGYIEIKGNMEPCDLSLLGPGCIGEMVTVPECYRHHFE